jgi:UDP-glucuronate decarboxylase
MQSPDEVTGPINIGNPVEISIRKLAEKVIEMTGSTTSLEYSKVREDDPKQRQPDIRRARELLGWEPTISLEEGLERTIGYFRECVAS